MDLIARAQEKRDWHKAELVRLEAFLATAFELENDLKKSPVPPRDSRSDAEKADAPKRQRQATRPQSGIGAETIKAAEEIIAERGPLSTRELLPLVLAKGIDVGGNDPVATLSARISGRCDLKTHGGKWFFEKDLPQSVRQRTSDEEAADSPAKESSAASLFRNQGDDNAAALTN
jgi:hypothetical protein